MKRSKNFSVYFFKIILTNDGKNELEKVRLGARTIEESKSEGDGQRE